MISQLDELNHQAANLIEGKEPDHDDAKEDDSKVDDAKVDNAKVDDANVDDAKVDDAEGDKRGSRFHRTL